MRKFGCLILLLSQLWSAPAHALLDLGVMVTNVSDLSWPSWNIGDGDVTMSMNLCIFSLAVLPTGRYGINVSSSGGYKLSGPNGNINYAVYWNDGGAGSLSGLGSQLTNNLRLGGRRNASTLSYLCALAPIGPNAKLTVKIASADMTAALAGTYGGTITITISPD